LADQIEQLGMGDFYTVQEALIVGRNGTEFVFVGLRHNISKIKSFEGVDIVWVEEAQAVSKQSLEVLLPTIRKPGSEIWLTFNPDLEEDDVFQRFIVWPPPGAPSTPSPPTIRIAPLAATPTTCSSPSACPSCNRRWRS